MLRRNGPVMKSVESVLRPEGSPWWERFVKKVGLEPGVGLRASGNLPVSYVLTGNLPVTYHQ